MAHYITFLIRRCELTMNKWLALETRRALRLPAYHRPSARARCSPMTRLRAVLCTVSNREAKDPYAVGRFLNSWICFESGARSSSSDSCDLCRLLGIRVLATKHRWIEDPRTHQLILLAVRRCPTENSKAAIKRSLPFSTDVPQHNLLLSRSLPDV
jgi:hypothetical protein